MAEHHAERAAAAVDVVIPVRNAARHLPAAIRSVLAQAPPPAQVIVVDDASTDASAAAAAAFGPAVRLLRRAERGGVSAARNDGIAAASAPLIAFLDADDLWTEDSLQARRAALDAAPRLDAAFGLVRQFLCDSLPPERRDRIRCPDAPQRGYLVGGMLARREVFARFGGFDPGLRAAQFVDWLAAARSGGLAVAMIDRVVLLRRLHGENLGLRHPELRGEYLQVVRRHLARGRRDP
ncbi:MAG: glycosyltransferase family A protein [Dongiaceae bacterium]